MLVCVCAAEMSQRRSLIIMDKEIKVITFCKWGQLTPTAMLKYEIYSSFIKYNIRIINVKNNHSKRKFCIFASQIE